MLRHLTAGLLIVCAIVPSRLVGQTCRGPSSRDPSWSRDGKTIVFSSDRNGPYDIWSIDVASAVAQQLTHTEDGNFYPFLSPDGRQVAFTAMPAAGQQVTLVDAGGGAVRTLTPTEDDAGDPSWLPDGRVIFSSARGGTRDLWVMKSDGSEARRLFEREGEEWAPRISPDGDRLLFQSERDGDTDVYVGRLDGSDVRAIAAGPGFEGVASWSPDGAHVAYYTRNAPATGGGTWPTAEIMVVSSAGGVPLPLTEDTVRDQSPNWSPDGSQIAWTSCASGHLEVWLMDADGANKRQLTHSVGGAGYP